MPHPSGRPHQFTPDKQQELLHHIAQGASVAEAARIVGVTLRTVQRTAKADDVFDHDLELALHDAAPDPEKLMRQAARTHWRAAAWLLERTNPDRYAKRRPHALSPDRLKGIVTLVIETALEATPPENREAVYRRARAAADAAIEAVLPDHDEHHRRLPATIVSRPTPLSLHEHLTELGDKNARDLSAMLTQETAARRAQLNATAPPPVGGVSDADSAPHPPSGGIMSPKMSVATKAARREHAATANEPPALPAA